MRQNNKEKERSKEKVLRAIYFFLFLEERMAKNAFTSLRGRSQSYA